jgi:WYL domain
MGNRSNTEQWAVMERLRFIERCAYWRGTVNRQDLARVFGLSMAQASADLQQYQQENPGALVYNLNRKRYEGAEGMTLRFCAPVLEEAMGLFLNGGREAQPLAMSARLGAEGESPRQVYVLPMPQRKASAEVERRIFLAVLNGLKIRVLYSSVNSGTEEWRWLHPRAFVHNGSRWHVRAWCETRQAWADFNLSRIAEAEWPQEPQSAPETDPEERMEVLKLKPHSELTDSRKASVERDYGMEAGQMEVPVPGLMADYLRSRLRLPLSDGSHPPPLLEEIR